MYLGLARTSLGPVLFLAPLIGGRVAELGGYPLVLSVSVALSLVALVLLWWMVIEPRHLATSAPNPEGQL
jgi:hypothetical protein